MRKKSRKNKVDGNLLKEICNALSELNGWGSVEIYVQGGKVTQITKRVIKKTNHKIND
jgi:hypothetical protein